MPLIEEGRKAPAFSLKDQAGKTHSLKDYAGRPVVLYFYPKDDTPGCTTEACNFRDALPDFSTIKATILGVSVLDTSSKAKFAAKHELNFPLLSDQTADVAKMYGVWKEKNLYGRRTWGVARTTFWIGGDGRIKKIYKKVDTAKHAEDVLADLRAARKK